MSTSKDKGQYRIQTPGLLIILAGAILVHALAVFLPLLFAGKSEATTPEGWIQRARELSNEGKHQMALDAYDTAFRNRPPVPAIWSEAEREREVVRRKTFEERRRLAEEQKAEEGLEEGTTEQVKDEPEKPEIETPFVFETPSIGDDW